MAKVYLVRHGEIKNPKGILYGQSDEGIELADKGKEQIHRQAQKIMVRSTISSIYHSPLRRTKQTAEILESQLHTGHLIADKRLIDTATILQGIQLSVFDKVWGGYLYHPELLAKGGESIEDVWYRMHEVLLEIGDKEGGKSAVIVSHGDPIRIVMMAIEGKLLSKALLGSDRHPVEGIDYPEKGSVTVLEISGSNIVKEDYWSSQ